MIPTAAMNAPPRDRPRPARPPPTSSATTGPASRSTTRRSSTRPSLGIYEDLERPRSASRSTRWNTTAHTLLFDLEDGCRQKEMSRELLRRELPGLPRKREVQVAVRINPFRTEEYEKDLALIRDLPDHFDVVMLAKAGEAYGAPEIRDLSRGARGAQPPHHHPADHRASQVAQDRARAHAVRDGEARGVRHPRLLQGDGHPDHAAPLDRGAQVLPARHPVRGAHRRQGRDRRRGDAHRPVDHAGEVRRARTTCAAGSTCTATRSRASSTGTPARRPRWGCPASR